MNNYDENIIRLIQVYLSGELTEKERNELEEWCEKALGNREFLHQMAGENLFSREYPLYHTINTERAVRQFEKTIGRKRYIFRQLMKYAAILILPLLGVVVWQWEQPQVVEKVSETIVPGSAKAVLTLAGGQRVGLSGQQQEDIEVTAGIKVKQENGILAYDAETGNKSSKVEYNTLSTGRGGEYCLILSDGTKVSLNAASSLKYPVIFSGAERRVQLEGEAYFEVAKDAAHAFIVETKGVEVKVYGTSFNINTSRLNEIQTVLVEGSIGVQVVDGGEEYRVHPGQMAVWKQADGRLRLKEVDVTLYTAWKDGIFRFERERLEDILNTLSNWYDVEIFYQNQTLKELHFSGHMERYDQITTILEAMTEATGVRFDVQGKAIIVSK